MYLLTRTFPCITRLLLSHQETYFLLEYNCFIILCQFLLYEEVNRLYVIHTFSPTWASLPLYLHSHPSRFSQSTELNCLCYTADSHQMSILYMVVYMLILISQFIPPSLPLPMFHMSVRYICVSIPALEIVSPIPFFQIPHTCINIQHLFFSF